MEFYNIKKVRGRKKHKCFLCGISIPEKTECTYESGKLDGDFFSRHSHNECSREWSRQNSSAEHGDEWYWFESPEDGEVKEWNNKIREKYLNKPVCDTFCHQKEENE
jgi:hypothetical protein